MTKDRVPKIVAKQVPPDYQESPWDYDERYDRYVVIGPRNWQDFWTEAYGVTRYCEEWFDDWGDMKNPEAEWIKPMSVREFLDFEEIKKTSGELWTRDELSRWIKLLNGHYWRHEEDEVCEMLNLLDGGNWQHKQICGAVQSEWADCYYDADVITDEGVQRIEANYFNLGTEWIINDNCGVYCYGWNDDMIRQELADAIGCEPEEIEMHKFAGWTSVADYEVV